MFTIDLERGVHFGYCAFFVNKKTTRRLWRQRSLFILSTDLQPHFYLPLCVYASRALQNHPNKNPTSFLDQVLAAISSVRTHTRVLRAYSCSIIDLVPSITLVLHPTYAGVGEESLESPEGDASSLRENLSEQLAAAQIPITVQAPTSPPREVEELSEEVSLGDELSLGDGRDLSANIPVPSEGNDSFYSAEGEESVGEEVEERGTRSAAAPIAHSQPETEGEGSETATTPEEVPHAVSAVEIEEIICEESFLRNQLVVTDGVFAKFLPTLMTALNFQSDLLPLVFLLWEQLIRDRRILVYGNDPHRVSMVVLSMLSLISPLVKSVRATYSPILVPMTDAPFIVKILKSKLMRRQPEAASPRLAASSPPAHVEEEGGLSHSPSPVDLQGVIEACQATSYIVGTTNPSVLHQLENSEDLLDCVVLLNCQWDKIHLPNAILSAGNVRLLSSSKYAKAPSTWIKSTIANNGTYLYCNSDPNSIGGGGLMGLGAAGGGVSALVTGVWLKEQSAMTVDQHKALLNASLRETLAYCQKISALGSVASDHRFQTLGEETLAVRHEERLRTVLREFTEKFLEPLAEICFQNQSNILKQLRLNPFTKLTLANAIVTKIHNDPHELLRRVTDLALFLKGPKKQRLIPLYRNFIRSSSFAIWLQTTAERKLILMRQRQWDLILSCTEGSDLKAFAAIELQNGLHYVRSFPAHERVVLRIEEELSRRGKRNFLD